MRTAIFFLIAAYARAACPSADHICHVTTSGSGSTCSSAAPCSLSQAVTTTATYGDTILVADGNYTGSPGTGNALLNISRGGTSDAQRITIKAQNKWGAVLDCNYNCHSLFFLMNGTAYWTIQDLDIRRGLHGGVWMNSTAHHVTLKGNRIRDIATNWQDDSGLAPDNSTAGNCGVYTSVNAHDLIFDGNTIANVGRKYGLPNSSTILRNHDHGIYSEATRGTVMNNIFYDMFYGWGIQLVDNANLWLIANNTFIPGTRPNTAFPGQITLYGCNNGCGSPVYTVEIRNNIFYQPGSTAIFTHTGGSAPTCGANPGTCTCTIDRNDVYGGGSVIDQTTNCTITNTYTSNPLLMDVTTPPYNLHLNGASPAKDAGFTVTAATTGVAVTTDYEGVSRPQGAAFDLGVYELAATAPRTFYVSSNPLVGDDNNDGLTTGSPFLTISKAALSAATPGDTLVIMDGTYSNEGKVSNGTDGLSVVTLTHSGTQGNPITFQAQNRGAAILDANNTTTDNTCNGAWAYFNLNRQSWITFDGLVIQNGCGAAIQSNSPSPGASNILFLRNTFRNIANRAIPNTDPNSHGVITISNYDSYFAFEQNLIYNIGRTTPGQMYDDAIYIQGIGSTASHVAVINNVFRNISYGWPIYVAGGGSYIFNSNTFIGPFGTGRGGIVLSSIFSDIAIRNNIFYNVAYSTVSQLATVTMCTYDHNLYYSTTESLVPFSGSGTGCADSGSNQANVNPLFVNAGTNDYHLQFSSPAKDTGYNLGGTVLSFSELPYSTDFDGYMRPVGTNLDIGAYEFQSGGANISLNPTTINMSQVQGVVPWPQTVTISNNTWSVGTVSSSNCSGFTNAVKLEALMGAAGATIHIHTDGNYGNVLPPGSCTFVIPFSGPTGTTPADLTLNLTTVARAVPIVTNSLGLADNAIPGCTNPNPIAITGGSTNPFDFYATCTITSLRPAGTWPSVARNVSTTDTQFGGTARNCADYNGVPYSPKFSAMNLDNSRVLVRTPTGYEVHLTSNCATEFASLPVACTIFIWSATLSRDVLFCVDGGAAKIHKVTLGTAPAYTDDVNYYTDANGIQAASVVGDGSKDDWWSYATTAGAPCILNLITPSTKTCGTALGGTPTVTISKGTSGITGNRYLVVNTLVYSYNAGTLTSQGYMPQAIGSEWDGPHCTAANYVVGKCLATTLNFDTVEINGKQYVFAADLPNLFPSLYNAAWMDLDNVDAMTTPVAVGGGLTMIAISEPQAASNAGCAKMQPVCVISTYSRMGVGAPGFVSKTIATCTNVVSSVCTTTLAHGFASGTTSILLGGFAGCPSLNAAWTATYINTTQFSINNGAAPGVCTTNTGAVTAQASVPVANLGIGAQQMFLFNGLGTPMKRYASRSIIYDSTWSDGFPPVYSQPRAGLSMDAAHIIFGDNNGFPGQASEFLEPTGISQIAIIPAGVTGAKNVIH